MPQDIMISAMEYLLEAENCMTAAQGSVDPDDRAEYLRRSACYRNLALEVMRSASGRPSAFSLQDTDDPCVFAGRSGSQRRIG